jgi:hypothetical protein
MPLQHPELRLTMPRLPPDGRFAGFETRSNVWMAEHRDGAP